MKLLVLALGTALLQACASSPSSPPGASAPQPPSPGGTVQAEFGPLLVDPKIPLESIQDEATALVTSDPEELVRFVEKASGNGPLNDEHRALLMPPRARQAAFSKVIFPGGNKVLFALRTHRDGRVVFFDRTSDDIVIPTVAFLKMALHIDGATPGDTLPWYREMARRVGTARRATGIVLYPNGNAIAVLVGEESVPDSPGDLQLVALTHFFKAGTYKADAWGPQLHATEGVRTEKKNNHDGVSIVDILREGKIAESAPSVVF